MNDKEQIVKHLEIIQGIINRLAHNSFFIKGWSMGILAAAILFISKNQNQSPYLILCFLIPVFVFWILDSYFLWQERLFRGIYNDVRKQEKTNFEMNILSQKNKPKCKWYHSFFSVNLGVFYIMETVFIIAAFFTGEMFSVRSKVF